MKMWTIAILLACSMGTEAGIDLIYPWVTSNPNFQTRVVVVNLNGVEVDVTLVATRGDGASEQVVLEVEALSQLVMSGAQLFPTLDGGSGYAVRMTSAEDNIRGRFVVSSRTTASGDSPAQAAVIDPDSAANVLLYGYVPIPTDGGVSALVAVNPSEAPVDVTFYAYQNGARFFSDSVIIPGGSGATPYAAVVTDLFPDLSGDLFVVAATEQPILGTAFLFNGLGEPSMANAETLASVPEITDAPDPNAMKVLSYNTSFAAQPSEADKTELIALMQSEAPDIIGFQELGSATRQDIEAGLSGYSFYYGNDNTNSNPIAVKDGVFTIHEDGSIPLEVAGCNFNFRVSYLRLSSSGGQEFLVVNDHYCRGDPATHALAMLPAVADLFPELPLVMTGDLNSSEGTSVMEYLLNHGDLGGQTSPISLYDTWNLLDTGSTRFEAGLSIDWVLVNDTNTWVVSDKSRVNDGGLSDHDPVTATLNFVIDDRNTFQMPRVLGGTLVDGKRVFDLTMQRGQTEFFPGQITETMGYNGSFYGPTLMFHKNETVVLNVTNNLGLDTTNHWHGFHLPAEMDGGPHQMIPPDTTWSPSFEVLNRAGLYWYHPHIMTMGSRQSGTDWQVWQGLEGLIVIRDDLSQSLPLPKTFGIDDIPLSVQDRQFDANAQFREPPFEDLGYIFTMRKGTTLMVNGVVNPVLESHAQMIRLRLHNGSNARTYNFGFDDGRTYYQIATDGGFLEAPVPLTRLIMGVGERAEILVDFSNDRGKEVKLKSYNSELGSIYVPDGLADLNDRNDFDVFTIRVGERTVNHVETMPQAMATIEPPLETDAVNADNPRLFFMAARGMTINGKQMDINRIDEFITLGDTEIWEISSENVGGEQAHPFHVHGDSFYVLSREYNGVVSLPPENERGWKDVVLVRPGEKVKIIKSFLDFSDSEKPYMYHCHIMKHEDSGMMGQWVVVGPEE